MLEGAAASRVWRVREWDAPGTGSDCQGRAVDSSRGSAPGKYWARISEVEWPWAAMAAAPCWQRPTPWPEPRPLKRKWSPWGVISNQVLRMCPQPKALPTARRKSSAEISVGPALRKMARGDWPRDGLPRRETVSVRQPGRTRPAVESALVRSAREMFADQERTPLAVQ